MTELIGGYVDGCPDELWQLDEGTYRNVQAEYTKRLNELKQSDKNRNVVAVGSGYVSPQHTTLAHVIKQQIERAKNGNSN